MPTSPPSPSTNLVAAAQGGDTVAFEELYRRHVGRVYALCLRMTGNRQAAEELCQLSFVRAWEGIASFRGDSSFGTWLHKLTVNVVLGDRRSQGRRMARFEPSPDPDVLSAPVRPDGASLDLEGAIAVLPPKARAVFVLHDVQGMSPPSLQVETVSGDVTVHKARGRMEAETVSGEVTVQGGPFARVELSTVSGDVVLQGSLEASARVELDTHSGDVTVLLPPLEHVAYALSSFSGEIEGFLADRKVSGFGPGSTVALLKGDGTTGITVSTHSGDIDIQQTQP